MGRAVSIDDPNDPRIAVFRAVRERDLKGRDGLFLGEGPLTVERMLALPGVAESLLVEERKAEAWLGRAAPGVAVYAAKAELLDEILGFPFHRGVLAAGRREPFEGRTLGEVLPPTPHRATLLLIDGVTNVDNIGLLFRNAAAFSCDGAVLSSSCHDPLYRKALRVSLGHVLSLPWCRVADWGSALEELKEAGVAIVAAALGPRSRSLDGFDPPDRVALAVGQEFEGVSSATLEAADAVVRIPMAPGVDSLNVAAASAVCLHRLSRGPRA